MFTEIIENLRTKPAKSVERELQQIIELSLQKELSSPAQIAELAKVLAQSGAQLDIHADVIADVASTGGPTSLSTLLSPLYLRAAGAVVVKLGVPGRPAGGIDCLANIAGYCTFLSVSEVNRVVDAAGYAHFSAGETFAPLDAKLFEIRQQSGAQEVAELVIASLLAKKVAAGVKYVGLDIRVAPHGNFGRNWNDAKQNASLFLKAAEVLELDASPVLTNGAFPYQPYIGRKESLLALHELFESQACTWLVEHCAICKALALACLPLKLRAAAASANFGQLRRVFELNLVAQGSTYDTFSRIAEATRQAHSLKVVADRGGFFSPSILKIRDALTYFQKVAKVRGPIYPDPVGIILCKRPGDWINAGDLLATARVDESFSSIAPDILATALGEPTQAPIGPGLEALIDPKG